MLTIYYTRAYNLCVLPNMKTEYLNLVELSSSPE